MGTLRLLWGMTVRGAGWTMALGALLGAVYSVLVIGALFLITRLYGSGNSQPPPPGTVLLLMVFVLGIGGGIVGGVIGLVFGPLGGLLCSLMTRLSFWPLVNVRGYHRAVGMAGAAYGLIATPVGLWVISGFNVAPPTGQTENALLFYVLPALVGAAAGYVISQQIAAWYKEESASSRAHSRVAAPTTTQPAM